MFTRRRRLCIIILIPLAGCAGTRTPQTPPDHPANASAPEAAVSPPTQTLDIDQPPATSAPDTATAPMGGMQMGHEMQGMSHDMPGMQHPTPATSPATTQAAVTYTCPMHPEVISDKPGKCPKCGMTLVKKGGKP